MLNVWSLHSNSMYYVSPTFAGAKFGIQYSMTGDADKEAELWEERDQWVNGDHPWMQRQYTHWPVSNTHLR